MSNSDIIRLPKSPISWAELQACSNFSFLKGGSHPEEYMDRAALLGLAAVAIADDNSVAGIVRAHTHAGLHDARRITDTKQLYQLTCSSCYFEAQLSFGSSKLQDKAQTDHIFILMFALSESAR